MTINTTPKTTPKPPTNPPARLFRLPDGTRSTQSPWIWRAFLFMSLIALGLCLTFTAGHQTLYALAWATITLGWFTISMWLWHRHTRYDDQQWRARKAASSRAPSTARRG
jgi:hypothetical protein